MQGFNWYLKTDFKLDINKECNEYKKCDELLP